MKTKKRIRRLIKELKELEQANKEGHLAGVTAMGPPDLREYLGNVHWSGNRGIGS